MSKDKKKKKENGEKEKEVEELKNQLARALADYDNLRKRVEKEKEEIVRLASVSLFAKLMPSIDALKRAQSHLKDEGLDQVLKDIKKALEEEGIVKIEAEKEDSFDENSHEVVEVEETDDKNKRGKIAEVMLEGWRLKDGPVIRPTKVKVYKDKGE